MLILCHRGQVYKNVFVGGQEMALLALLIADSFIKKTTAEIQYLPSLARPPS